MSARNYEPRPKQYTEPKQKTWMKKERSDNTGKLRKTLDEVFSKYVRSLSKKCFTCEKGKNEHCGHFMRRGNDATRWLESNARPQCWECNILKEGNLGVFRDRLVLEIGEDGVSHIEKLSREDIKFSAPDLEEMIFMYREKLKA